MPENSLHSALKNYLQQPEDQIEHIVDSYIVDIVRGKTLFEIQTRNFYALRPKLSRLLEDYVVHIVHPIAAQKWIVRKNGSTKPRKRRKSPKHGTIYQIFDQLIYIPEYLSHPNLVIDVLLVEQEDVWENDGRGSWRRKGWSLVDQRLIEVIEHHQYHSMDDLKLLFPPHIPPVFRNNDLALYAGIPLTLARKMTYTLTKAGLLSIQGKAGMANLYTQVDL